jgi:hypothetical protein
MVTSPETPRFAEFRAIIMTWPSLAEMAADIGVPKLTVSSWRRRNNIPEEYWSRIADAAVKRGFHAVTYDRCRECAANWRRSRTRQAGASAAHYETRSLERIP